MIVEYRVRVNTSLVATKFLFSCCMPFRGSDESINSLFKGSFLELVVTLKKINSEIASVINCAPGNNLITAPKIQKDLPAACASETTQQIICDIADDVFCVLIDECGDVARKEQIIRGKRYDGASNMRGNFGGLRTLIQNMNPSAYYVHYFAHQLQLALVACAKTHKDVSGFLRQELPRDKQVTQFAKLIEEGQIETGSGLNQESSIARAGDTHWGSHVRTLTSLMTLYDAIIGVLEEVGNDTSFEKHGETMLLLDVLQSFDLIFILYMMVEIVEFTND
ncbi:uncharacterized protein LOC131657920 [Vicia villosa]|uniref:uncharacterized protein LOC131657920 n=1 Tax=Vicia villosa TaxID=3911 RepID=UPI00273BD88B|nr:uncharacterized protein LOC131657920 [Vicia villosa]